MSNLVKNAPHADITFRIIGAAMAVHNELGPGHREEVYHNAMLVKMPLPACCSSILAARVWSGSGCSHPNISASGKSGETRRRNESSAQIAAYPLIR